MAPAVKAGGKPVGEDNPFRKIEEMGSEWITASLEPLPGSAGCHERVGLLPDLRLDDRPGGLGGCQVRTAGRGNVRTPRELPFVKEALAAIEKGGYTEASRGSGAWWASTPDVIPLERLELTDEIIRSDKMLSKMSEDEMRRLRSEAEVVVLLEPERTLHPFLPAGRKPEDKKRVLSLLELVQSEVSLHAETADMARADHRRALWKEGGGRRGKLSPKRKHRRNKRQQGLRSGMDKPAPQNRVPITSSSSEGGSGGSMPQGP